MKKKRRDEILRRKHRMLLYPIIQIQNTTWYMCCRYALFFCARNNRLSCSSFNTNIKITTYVEENMKNKRRKERERKGQAWSASQIKPFVWLLHSSLSLFLSLSHWTHHSERNKETNIATLQNASAHLLLPTMKNLFLWTEWLSETMHSTTLPRSSMPFSAKSVKPLRKIWMRTALSVRSTTMTHLGESCNLCLWLYFRMICSGKMKSLCL